MRQAITLPQACFFSLVLVACGGGTTEAPTTASAASPASAATTTSSTPAPAASSVAIATPASSAPGPVPAAAASDAAAAPSPTAAAAAPSAKPAPAKISARHVLIQYMGCQNAASSVVRTRDQAYTVAKDVLRRAKKGEDFARLAVEFSDEPNAGARGGSLGRFGRGAMVKQFEDAAFALKPGEISDVVESPFGFHVIQRTE